MYRIRPIKEQDRQALHTFAEEAFIGITNLPKNAERREKLLQRALAPHPKNYYLFLLEDFEKKTALGVCGIFPKTENLDYFKLQTATLPGYFPESPKEITYLERIQYEKGPTEICSLYLAPEGRNLGIGKLLSFSRFYFMKAFPELFEEDVFAEMRGVIDENGDAPFWESLGRHFLSISYKELMKRVDAGETRVKELMPLKTVYVDLLDPKGQQAIGKTYHNTTPAYKILEEQNFRFTNEIDLFDAGPRVLCKREAIATIKQSKIYRVNAIRSIESPNILIANTHIEFRVCLGKAIKENEGAVIDPMTADLLEIQTGDQILAIL